MMSTASPCRLTPEQASRLQMHIQIYRRHAFISSVPSTARNTVLRALQSIQSKLIEGMNQNAALLLPVMTTEELTTLKAMITELLALYAREPASAERNTRLGDLAELRVSIKRSHTGESL